MHSVFSKACCLMHSVCSKTCRLMHSVCSKACYLMSSVCSKACRLMHSVCNKACCLMPSVCSKFHLLTPGPLQEACGNTKLDTNAIALIISLESREKIHRQMSVTATPEESRKQLEQLNLRGKWEDSQQWTLSQIKGRKSFTCRGRQPMVLTCFWSQGLWTIKTIRIKSIDTKCMKVKFTYKYTFIPRVRCNHCKIFGFNSRFSCISQSKRTKLKLKGSWFLAIEES